MNSPMVRIKQADEDIGWGKLGAMTPLAGETTEITLHDVQMVDGLEFAIDGPFRVTIEDKRYDDCKPVNFRRLRPGCTYDRVIFTTDSKPRQERISPPDTQESPD
ncbi:MAG: hypothetical protein JXQ83_00355 [Candidatus Glassbacteria bacterium]|nr:hypothetical protein [Candidatus Glassbacteria bacterium]